MNFFILCFFDLSTVFCKIWVSCWFRHDGARVFSSGHLVQDLSGAFGEATIHGMFPTPLPAPDICPNNWIEAAIFQCVYTGRYGPFQHFPNSIYCSRVYTFNTPDLRPCICDKSHIARTHLSFTSSFYTNNCIEPHLCLCTEPHVLTESLNHVFMINSCKITTRSQVGSLMSVVWSRQRSIHVQVWSHQRSIHVQVLSSVST